VQLVFDVPELDEVIAKGSLEFEEWTALISEIEKSYPVSPMNAL
jgi:hypothetical protein